MSLSLCGEALRRRPKRTGSGGSGSKEKPERSEGGKGSVAEGMCLLFAEAVSGLHGLQTDVHPDGGMSTFSYLSVGSASRRTQQFLSPCSKISV